MSKKTNPPDRQAAKEARTDDLDAALEESEEQNEEDQVIEDAEANQKKPSTERTEQS